MSRTKKTKAHAPYFYLCPAHGGGYDLFLIVITLPSFKVISVLDPEYDSDGNAVLQILVIPQLGEDAKYNVLHKHLNPAADIAHFDPNSNWLRVEAVVHDAAGEEQEKHHVNVFYEYSDDQPIAYNSQHPLAYNCPYIHLGINENGEHAGFNELTPYVLIAGIKAADETDQEVLHISHPNEANLEAIYRLDHNENEAEKQPFDSDFIANTDRFYDLGKNDGAFTATVFTIHEDANVPNLNDLTAFELHQLQWEAQVGELNLSAGSKQLPPNGGGAQEDDNYTSDQRPVAPNRGKKKKKVKTRPIGSQQN